MLKTAEVNHGQYHIVVGEASILTGVRRFTLMNEGETEIKKMAEAGTPLDSAEAYLRWQVYPTLVAGVVKAEGFETWPPAFSEFLQLPEGLWELWTNANHELNPGWYPKEEPPDPKEPTPSTSDSSA